MDTETTLPVSGAEDGEVFVKGPARFIISDDLQVMPPFTSTSSSLVKNLGFTGWNSIEELTVNVGVDEMHDNSMKGCTGQLYKSVQDLDEQCLKSNNHKKMLVSPKLLPGFGCKKEPSFGNRGSLVLAGC
ncbi:uncharacterized protein Pyn_13672 [Prunus yedoensis var. nudiflora]|uniref:Uncharacterized protein n=1 Tax=Prunus yedoensis var. nudiflora TaxID=2094558 RepID=A0A314YKJ1_PRUYE|nr:uncharacterized protein Pyn_13672 [Prunus yedoensis var. nudiflora]